MSKTHGYSGTTTSRCWQSMLRRCTNPNYWSWARYGGRGIKVCDRWRESFENFLEDMGEKPHGRLLDRIDNDGHYEKANCRWVTAETQANNRGSSAYIQYKDDRLTISQWAKRLGIGTSTLGHRIRSGWGIARAMETPVNGNLNSRRARQ